MTASGADLNRNYGYHYGETLDDTDKCSETYRGPASFSEPETQAIKSLIENEMTIASAMNFHCYGNIWIHPFNYMHEPHKYPINAYKNIINFYEEFKHEVAKVSAAKYGNAIETVDYPADGEASDWMLGEHMIVAFSPELGSFNPKAQTFFLPKDLIYEVIQENFKVVELFMRRNNFEIEDPRCGIDNHSEFFIKFTNRGLANIFSPTLVMRSPNADFLSGVKDVTVHNEDGEYIKIELENNQDVVSKGLAIKLPKINRLNAFNMSLKVADPALLKTSIVLNIDIIMADGTPISNFEIAFENERYDRMFTLTLLGIIGLFIIMFIVFGWKIAKISRDKSAKRNADEPTAREIGMQSPLAA